MRGERNFARLAVLAAALAAGCRSISVTKNPPLEVRDGTNVVKYVDGGWSAEYRAYGMLTSIGTLTVEIDPTGTVKVSLGNFNSDMSTNHAAVVGSAGKPVADVAGTVIQSVKH